MKTLDESFKKFINGDTISDYKCEGCKKKVEVTNRFSLSKLPNLLTIHL